MTEGVSVQPTVTVAVCTFRRNELLRALVGEVDRLAKSELPNGSVRVLIVDDSPEGKARAVVDELRAQVAVAVEYHASAASDISVARNHALKLGTENSEYVACIDDDCLPKAGWLRELVGIAEAYEADVVVGHRQFVAEASAPRWLSAEPFLAENALYPNGSVPAIGNTANMLVRSSWVRSSAVRFRSEMGRVGGEDMVFFADAARAGANIRFAANSVCAEPCTGRRATFRYQAWRQFWLGNNEATINRTTHQVSRIRLLARGTKRVGSGFAHPFARLLRRRSPQCRWGLALVLRGAGSIVGVVGLRLRHHSV